MYKALHLSPMIPSLDMKGTVMFFKDYFDFEIAMDEKTYAIIHKDNLTVHILPAGSHIGEMEFYLEVDNIEQLWKNIKDKLDGFKFKAPFNTDYGMREIHINIPHTKALIFIGQEIKSL